MTSSRSRVLLAGTLAAVAAVVLGTAGAAALTQRATAPQITAAGVGAVKLGKTYTSLRAAGLVAKIGPGCELSGPQARSARLRAPLKGAVDFTHTTPRKAATITVRGGAKARGVGVGATVAAVKLAFPKVVADHSTDTTFAITLYKVPASGGGRLQFAVDTKTKKVTLIGIPNIPFCE